MEGPDEFTVDFPTLWVVPDWIEAHCPIPDGDHKGEPFVLYDWQLWCTVNHYRIKVRARAGQKAPAFFHRRSQVVAPQKTGKGPWSATVIAAEGVGPVVFDGWAQGGERYDCRRHGCGCGWVYEYEPGEPMGRPWATPLIQLLATAEDQTDNVYRPLQAIAKNGPLGEIMRVGEEFIRLPNDGRIDVITSSALARLGNPITFALQDETGLYTATNKLVRVAETQRRGLAGMGGRAMETTNAWDPREDSTARRTAESRAVDIFRFHRPPPPHLDYDVKDQRREIHAHVYRGSDHVDLDAIEAEAYEIMEKDRAQAERFFGNRLVPGSGAAFNGDRWDELGNLARIDRGESPVPIPSGQLITLGVDGARFRDALAIRACDVLTGHRWTIDIQERPADAGDDYEHDFDRADQAALDAFSANQVWRVYIDPQYIDLLVDRWQGRWGDRIIQWFTYRKRPMCFALQAYNASLTAGDFTHDSDPVMGRHIRNATKVMTNVHDDEGRPMWILEKADARRYFDGVMADCLAVEARGDAIAAGAQVRRKGAAVGF